MSDQPAGALSGPSITADALGDELARSVRQRAENVPESLADFVRTMSLDVERVRVELAYLSIVTMHFCVGVASADRMQQSRVLSAFYRGLWSGPTWLASEAGLAERLPQYETALNNPHPDLGRGYGMGRVFARWCGASHDVSVIEVGALAYVDQLPPILSLLRGVRVL
jgi:hypothetical protein